MFDFRIFSFEDARRMARRHLPRLVFDYIDGAAGNEQSNQRNISDLEGVLLHPRVLRAVPERDMKSQVLGQSFERPFGISPMGMCNLACPNADQMLAEAAAEFGMPHCVSAAASSTLEDVRHWAGDRAWFQLYVTGPIEQSMEMVSRAKEAGYETLVLTVDVPHVARRRRDLRNGFTMPFRMGMRQFIDFALHPVWSLSSLYHGAPSPKNFEAQGGAFNRNASRAGADWGFLDQLRERWDGKLVVKGVMNVADALKIQAAGADAVWVSNHGGRQLDSAPSAISVLPKIRAAVGPSFPLIFDSGVRNGEDIARVLASGADFVMLGRPFLFALGANGKKGLRSYIDLISQELDVVMAQIGVASISEIDEGTLASDQIEIEEAEPRIATAVRGAT